MWWPYLIKLLEKGVLPGRRYHGVPAAAGRQGRTRALDELAALNQEMGLYEN